MLIQITASRFCAGAILRGDVVIECAPILRKKIMGMDRSTLRKYASVNKWTIKIIEFDNQEERKS